MAEPTTTAIAGASVSGAGAFLLAVIGVEPQPLFWALIGATLGITFATASTRLRAVTVFVCVVFAASLLGTWAADACFRDSSTARNAAALVVAAVFHPLLAALVAAVPGLVSGAIRLLPTERRP